MTRTAVAGAAVATAATLVIALLATSRAAAHVLTPTALAVVTAAAAGAGVMVGWVNGLYRGAHDVVTGATALSCAPGCPAEPEGDPWLPVPLARTTGTWMLAVALWAGAGGALAAVALDGRRARLVVVFAVLAGLVGTGAVVVDTVARHRGAHAVRTVAAAGAGRRAISLRRRAWLQVAAPLAGTQVVINAAFVWLLFHDYTTGGTGGGVGTPLTEHVALADVVVLVTILAVLFGTTTARWGATDALLDRVTLDGSDDQRVTAKSRLGAQGLVYIAAGGLVVGRLAGIVLPAQPTLWQVALVRGAFAGALVFVAAGAAYVRGAVNAAAEADR